MDTNKEWRKAMGMWLIAILAVAVLALLGGCVHPRLVPAPQEVTTIIVMGDWPGSAIGLTTCTPDNKPIVILRDIPLDENDRKVILVHEMTHVRQMMGNCHAVQALYKLSPEFRQKMELEAYCEDSRFALSLGVNVEYVARRLNGLMKQLYNLDEARCSWVPP